MKMCHKLDDYLRDTIISLEIVYFFVISISILLHHIVKYDKVAKHVFHFLLCQNKIQQLKFTMHIENMFDKIDDKYHQPFRNRLYELCLDWLLFVCRLILLNFSMMICHFRRLMAHEQRCSGPKEKLYRDQNRDRKEIIGTTTGTGTKKSWSRTYLLTREHSEMPECFSVGTQCILQTSDLCLP